MQPCNELADFLPGFRPLVIRLANTVLLCRRHHRLVHEGRVRMALDRLGQAVFFARSGTAVASAPPLPEPTLPLPPPPPLPPGKMYNGAARLLDSAIPWEIEAAAREAVEAAPEAGESGKQGGEPGKAVEQVGRAGEHADVVDRGTGGRREDPDRRRSQDNPPPPARAA